jgi:hypothetical protein
MNEKCGVTLEEENTIKAPANRILSRISGLKRWRNCHKSEKMELQNFHYSSNITQSRKIL